MLKPFRLSDWTTHIRNNNFVKYPSNSHIQICSIGKRILKKYLGSKRPKIFQFLIGKSQYSFYYERNITESFNENTAITFLEYETQCEMMKIVNDVKPLKSIKMRNEFE